MFGSKRTITSKPLWIDLQRSEQLQDINTMSETMPVVIFKHSTRCGTSAYSQRRLMNDWPAVASDTTLFFLDLLSYRQLSNTIAEKYDVSHESPQLIVIWKGQAIANTSHHLVNVDFIQEVIENIEV
jgi:bacillithiol system protein YtxJ